MKENTFVQLKDFPNYEIDINGNVRNIKTKKILKPRLNTNGYLRYTLIDKNGEKKEASQHRLVKLTFDYIDGCESLFVDHINCVKTDNRLSNLDWVTQKENYNRAVKNNLLNHVNRLIDDNLVIQIRKEYIPGVTGNLRELKNKYKIGLNSILDIISNKTFTNLPKTEELSEYYLRMKNYKYYQGPYYDKLEIPKEIQEEIKYKFSFYHRTKVELSEEYKIHRKTIESIIFNKYKIKTDRKFQGLKLTEKDVSNIKKSLKSGITISELAKKYNVHTTSIRNIANEKTWSHIK